MKSKDTFGKERCQVGCDQRSPVTSLMMIMMMTVVVMVLMMVMIITTAVTITV